MNVKFIILPTLTGVLAVYFLAAASDILGAKPTPVPTPTQSFTPVPFPVPTPQKNDPDQTPAQKKRAKFVPSNGVILSTFDRATSAAQAITAFRASPGFQQIRTDANAANQYQDLRRHLLVEIKAIEATVTTFTQILDSSGTELESNVFLSTFNESD